MNDEERGAQRVDGKVEHIEASFGFGFRGLSGRRLGAAAAQLQL
jgi:hypothetical protein